MMDLPGSLGQGAIHFWRLDHQQYSATWNSGEGSYRYGGRWNSPGVRAVYCSLDPSTAVFEVAAHKGLNALNCVPHVLTRATVARSHVINVIRHPQIPNSNWLMPTAVSGGQQQFGDNLLQQHGAIIIPSTVSRQAWNLIFIVTQPRDPGRELVESVRLSFWVDVVGQGPVSGACA
ncbi:RES family NAD+ phosphorylase (plasmid) [Glycocaulis abyssi]|uniref:RES family NAD+ phosphorylase n=1 Tax=Glycocaulis abyssi TaxID=1433403 RepID=A0ABV9NF18_9PROT